MLKIIDLAHARSIPMDGGRGRKTKLVDASLGTQAVDVHMNVLAPGGPCGKLHKHSAADNVYIVRKGVGELIVEGETYVIRKDHIVFIPSGMTHSLSKVSSEPFEIYAPAGDQFDLIASE